MTRAERAERAEKAMTKFTIGKLSGLNNTEAYKAAVAEIGEEPVASASQAGYDWKKNPEYKAALDKLTSLAKMDGALLKMEQIQAALSAIAMGVPQDNGHGERIVPTMGDRLNAYEKLIRMQGGYIDRSAVELTNVMPVVINDDIKE